MASHHFIGTGPYSERLARLAADPEGLSAAVASRIRDVGFEVVLSDRAAFSHGGQTFVWVLAESHLVLHYWGEEGFATIDLHICDYRESNATRAESLVEALEGLCFVPQTAAWERLTLREPRVTAWPRDRSGTTSDRRQSRRTGERR